MYRCTECNAEYDICPDFCDCGNDSFIEIEDSYQEQYYEEPVRPVAPRKPKKRVLSEQEIAEMEEEAADKKKALIALAVSLVLCIIVLFLPPHKTNKVKQMESNSIKIAKNVIDVNSYWDTTLPSTARKKDPYWNLPVLNSNLGAASPALKNYLKYVGGEYSRQWDKNLIQGSGKCKIVLTINKEGVLGLHKILEKSNNQSLDDSVLLLISRISSFEIPPDDYKGEKIVIAFEMTDNGASKVYFPSM